MIDRYSLPEMTALWSDQKKLEVWLEIEVLACEAMAALGQIPEEDARTIREKAGFDLEEIQEIEKTTNHDVIAFLENVARRVGPAGRWIHKGLTSSDILDTGLAVQTNEACGMILDDLKALCETIAERAREHKMTPMIGRSHGVHAEPITFGLKMALMYDEFQRNIERLEQSRERIRVGALSGAVGTHAHLDPEIERQVCEGLGLIPDPLSTQIVQRDRHAEIMNTLALIGSSIERWAVEFRHLQRTEVLEVEEAFGKGQKGSSAMPHKRNPISGETLTGLARVLRGNASAAMQDVALWHERDISHSSVERIIFPDSFILVNYMLNRLNKMVGRLVVHADNMERNMNLMNGLFYSQSVLLKLTEKGVQRKDAYEAVQRASMRTWQGQGNLLSQLKQEAFITEHLTEPEIESCCSLEPHLRHVDAKFKNVGID
jgi:adenylosuccinate lyase